VSLQHNLHQKVVCEWRIAGSRRRPESRHSRRERSWRRRHIAQRRVRSPRVVLHAPLLDHHLRFLQRIENLPIQALPSQFPDETFAVSIHPRTAGFDVPRPGVRMAQPFPFMGMTGLPPGEFSLISPDTKNASQVKWFILSPPARPGNPSRGKPEGSLGKVRGGASKQNKVIGERSESVDRDFFVRIAMKTVGIGLGCSFGHSASIAIRRSPSQGDMDMACCRGGMM
jgi:hypothetical protein